MNEGDAIAVRSTESELFRKVSEKLHDSAVIKGITPIQPMQLANH
jgi:hypothetical protein